MKRLSGILLLALVAVSCSEVVEMTTDGMDRACIVVESILTDRASDPQTVRLSTSVPYFYNGEIPCVSGAKVRVSDGETEVPFGEDPEEKGLYVAPEGYACVPGKTYTLSIEATLEGEDRSWSAEAFMHEPGAILEAVDYAYYQGVMQQDSLWTLGLWGEDMPDSDYFMAVTEVNGKRYPIDMCLIMPDKYFGGKSVEGFPISLLYQTAEMRKQYGDVAKYLETGDVISLVVYTLDKPFYEFLRALDTSGPFGSIPFISSQPATCPTNVTGGDALGFFAVCPVISASVTVDDPFRTEFIYGKTP